MDTLSMNPPLDFSPDFSLLIVLITIILGIPITRIISGFSTIIKNSSKLHHSFTVYTWMVIILIVCTQHWWQWSMLGDFQLSFFQLLVGIFITTSLAIFCHSIVPDFHSPDVASQMIDNNNRYDIRDFYFRHVIRIASFAIALVFLLALWNWYSFEMVAIPQLPSGEYQLDPDPQVLPKLPYRILWLILLFTVLKNGSKVRKIYLKEGEPIREKDQIIHFLCAIIFLISIFFFMAQFT